MSEYRKWETEHYFSVLEITRLHSFFSGAHKWEPDIYSGFSPALHLQCGLIQSKDLNFTVALWTGHPIDYMIEIVE
jgi:hypothetical protein